MTEPSPINPISLDETYLPMPKSRRRTPESGSGRGAASVFLRPPEQHEPQRLSKLARVLGLETCSPVLLTKRVRVELEILAMVLAGVFVFEYLAWSFFFNGLFAGDVLIVGWSTLAAAVLALPFAATILYFERQVITTDTYRLKKRDRYTAQGIRLLAILAAAFIVAHPVELIAFRLPVEEMLYQNAVAEKEEELEKNLKELAKSSIGDRREALQNEHQRVRNDLKEARRVRNQAVADSDNYRRQREVVESELSREQTALTQAQRRIDQQIEEDGAMPPSLQRERDRWLDRVETKRQQLRSLSGRSVGEASLAENIDQQIEQLEQEEEQLEVRRGKLDEEALRFEEQLRSFKTHSKNKISELRRAGSRGDAEAAAVEGGGNRWPEAWNELLEFQKPQPNFFQKLGVLYDIVFGRTAREGINPYRLVFLGIHLAAAFIPSLIFVTKWWLMPQDVNFYYSLEHQARAGDPEAQMMLSIDEQVRQTSLVEEGES